MSYPTTHAHFTWPQPVQLVINSRSTQIYSVDSGNNTISLMGIDARRGHTNYPSKPEITFVTGNRPSGLALDPTETLAYVINGDDDTIWEYSVLTDGTLQRLSNRSVATGDNPTSITIDPTGMYAYVTNGGDDTVSQ